jgi:CO/xanthine dehydrogenase Mo-binding subunit
VKIDTTRAKALPGVRAIVTARDIPELKRKAPTRAHAVLAIDRVVFVGQPIAAVGGRDPVRHRRQPVPLYRVHEDAGGDHRSGGHAVRPGSLTTWP